MRRPKDRPFTWQMLQVGTHPVCDWPANPGADTQNPTWPSAQPNTGPMTLLVVHTRHVTGATAAKRLQMALGSPHVAPSRYTNTAASLCATANRQPSGE